MEISTHHHNHPGPVPIALQECHPHQHPDEAVRPQGGQVSRIGKALHQRNGAHGPVAAEVTREQQQPQVDRYQIVVGQLPGWRGGNRGRIVEPVREKMKSSEKIFR